MINDSIKVFGGSTAAGIIVTIDLGGKEHQFSVWDLLNKMGFNVDYCAPFMEFVGGPKVKRKLSGAPLEKQSKSEVYGGIKITWSIINE